MSKNNKSVTTFTVSEFYCTCCGTKGIPVPRKASKQRESGHLKKLYCLKCKVQTNHAEIRPFDYDKEDFLKDLAAGKFKKEEIKNGKEN